MNENGYTFEPPQMVEKFFYTTHYPHQWTSGPDFRYYNDEYNLITSLAEAKELAEKKAVVSNGDNRCDTSWGVIIECKVKKD